jgi:hypothetical protein
LDERIGGIMLPVFMLNPQDGPPQSNRRKPMARLTEYQKLVKRLAKTGLSGPALMQAASRAHRGGAGANPWIQGYSYWSGKRKKKVKVPTHFKPKAQKRKGRPGKRKAKPRGMSAKSKRKMTLSKRMAALGRKSGAVRRSRARARGAAQPKRRGGAMKRRAANPRVRGYSYFKPSLGRTVRVPGFRRKKGRKKTRNRPKGRRKGARKPVRRNQGVPFRYTVAPVTPNQGQPFVYRVPAVTPNKRRGRKKGYRRNYTRNPYVKAGFFENPGTVQATVGGFIKGFTASDFLMKELAPLGGGFIATKILTAKVLPMILKPGADASAAAKTRWDSMVKWKFAFEALFALASGLAVGYGLKKTDFAVRWTTGGLLASLVSAIEHFWGDWGKFTSLDGIGVGVSPTLKTQLAKAVREEIEKAEAGMSGYGPPGATFLETEDEYMDAYATAENEGGAMSAYATEDEMTAGLAEGGGIGLDAYLAEPAQGI